MVTIYHYPLCPFSRSVRLVVAEYGLDVEFVEERNWDRRAEFLALNAAGTVPVLVDDDGSVVCGNRVIFEYLEETRNAADGGKQLLPGSPQTRAEIRRLMVWFDQKFNEEVTRNLVTEKIDRRFMPKEQGGGAPDLEAVRAGLANIRHHLRYIGYLVRQRNWIAGDALTYADLCAAAHISCIDFLGDVPWMEDQAVYDWYARIKSRPSFRSLLCDQIRGVTPPASYADLDF